MRSRSTISTVAGLALIWLLGSSTVRAQERFIYWVGTTSEAANASLAIFRASLDDAAIDTVVSGGAIISEAEFIPVSVAIDTLHRKMYWTDNGAENVGRIIRAEVDGTAMEVLIEGAICGTGGLTDIELDLLGRKVYFALLGDCLGRDLMRADLDGSNFERDLLSGPGVIEYPGYIALDPVKQKIYWTGTDVSPAGVRRASFDGGDIETAVENPGQGVALDLRVRKLYWAAGNGVIRRANLDGTEIEDVIASQGDPTDLAIDVKGGHIYWTERKAGKIRRANLDGTGVEDLLSGLTEPNRLALTFENSIATSIGSVEEVPERFRLRTNYPNPFNESTTIAFDVFKPSQLIISIYDVLGRKISVISQGYYPPGHYSFNWKPNIISKGIYFCELRSENYLYIIMMIFN